MPELTPNSRYNADTFTALYDGVVAVTMEGVSESMADFVPASPADPFDRIVFIAATTTGRPEGIDDVRPSRDRRYSGITHVSFDLNALGGNMSESVRVTHMEYLLGAGAPYMFYGEDMHVTPPIAPRSLEAYSWAVAGGVALRMVRGPWALAETPRFRRVVRDFLLMTGQISGPSDTE